MREQTLGISASHSWLTWSLQVSEIPELIPHNHCNPTGHSLWSVELFTVVLVLPPGLMSSSDLPMVPIPAESKLSSILQHFGG